MNKLLLNCVFVIFSGCITCRCLCQQLEKRRSRVITKFNSEIYVHLKIVDPANWDSLNLQTTFINKSSSPFYLYKFLLPSDTLLRNDVFDFAVDSPTIPYQKIDFIDTSYGQYYEGRRADVPCVIPELNPDNFVLLSSGDSITFKINVARFYHFASISNKGAVYISASFRANFPFVRNGTVQIFEIDNKDKKKKPVFYSIGLPEADTKDKYLFQRVRFKVEH